MDREWREKLLEGNRSYRETVDRALLTDTALNGQHPEAIVICCSDSRVIPERIFHAELGGLFVIRVAGNVLDRHQLGSVEYAAAHLHCPRIVVLGHTGCGAVAAALSGGVEGYIRSITDEILLAVGSERDPVRASEKNVRHALRRLREAFAEHPEIQQVEVVGAMYDIKSGECRFLEEE